MTPELEEKLASLPDTIEELDAMVENESEKARLKNVDNMNVIKEYDDRENEIRCLLRQIRKYSQKKEQLHLRIEKGKAMWRRYVTATVNEIHARFSYLFSAISCAGEVSVQEDESNFDRWALHIRVGFRNNEELHDLTAYRQSGGEKSVTIMLFMLALQSRVHCPFRIVDEINQGMDQRNERLVHSLIVQIAEAFKKTQYFLITPKLLSGLEYSPTVKVHCIFAGGDLPFNVVQA
jgi:structural maintenance of chromosomes protein 5